MLCCCFHSQEARACLRRTLRKTQRRITPRVRRSRRRHDAGDPLNWRWPYSSSYQIVPASYSPDSARGGIRTVIQAGDTSHFQLTPGANNSLGRRKITDVTFTSAKIQMHEDAQRHYTKRWVFFGYDNASFPALLLRAAGGSPPPPRR